MSAESDFRSALLAHAPLVSLVGQRIALGAIEQGWAMPYIIYTTEHERELGLGGALLADHVTVQVQCWAQTAAAARQVADAALAAVAAQLPAAEITGSTTGYDNDLQADAVVHAVDWFIV